MEHTFTIDIKGSDTGQQFSGTFKYVRPNLGTQLEIDKTKTRLNGDLTTISDDTKYINGVLASLRHTLTDVPDWWVNSDFGTKLYDINVILEIEKACSNFENDWYNQVWKEDEVDTKASKNEGKSKKGA